MPEMITYIVRAFYVNLNILQFVNVIGILRSFYNDSRTLKAVHTQCTFLKIRLLVTRDLIHILRTAC